MTIIDDLSPEDLLILTNAIAIAFSKGKSADEINVLGNFIVGIGCLMLTIASQQQYIASLKDPNASEDTIIG
ncbi:hypothetical protein [Clostridium lacusfryxellense]|uniref:hypothetical protein n=1 Tax=Clostridium lacusfryxellense TaxID=205328 RepID=UPI001C0ACBCF|nr:hypothetical protein [Clostridium lacusfryxellense]MBU3109978.1 hypothetical protein [Clostridium lacusfryxellense]